MDIATETTPPGARPPPAELLGRLRDELVAVERKRGRVRPGAAGAARRRRDDLPAVELRLASRSTSRDRRDGARTPGSRSRRRRRRRCVVRLSEHLVPDAAYLGFLRLHRRVARPGARPGIAVRQAERRVSEVLQRSLLAQPPGSRAPGDRGALPARGRGGPDRRGLVRRVPAARRAAGRRRRRRRPDTTPTPPPRWRRSATCCAASPTRCGDRPRRCSPGWTARWRVSGSMSSRAPSSRWSRPRSGREDATCAGRTRATCRRCSCCPTATRGC